MLPRLGATTVVALIVLGQMIGSLAFDHFGFLGVSEQPITNLGKQPRKAFRYIAESGRKLHAELLLELLGFDIIMYS